MICKICGIRPAVNPGATCGNSYCQEAAYYLNASKNAKGAKAASLRVTASEKQELAGRDHA
jgi:hypothetical protein